jgi:heat shock protein HslJ
MKKNLILLLVGMVANVFLLAACGSINTDSDDPLEGTSWRLLFYRKSQVIEGTEITATFENDQVKGSSGCNSYFGDYQAAANMITVGPVGVTEMYCMDPEGVMDQEMFFLETLGDAQQFDLLDGRLTIIRSDGETLTFEPRE